MLHVLDLNSKTKRRKEILTADLNGDPYVQREKTSDTGSTGRHQFLVPCKHSHYASTRTHKHTHTLSLSFVCT